MAVGDEVLRDGAARRDERVATTYDALATTYADRIAGELAGKPFDDWLLRRVAGLAVAAGGAVLDAGCGPGHVTRFLTDAGADVVGADLSEGMVAEARRRFPGLPFEQGDLFWPRADAEGGGWGAVLAWYSLVHVAGSELSAATAALSGVLRPGGWLVIALHVGSEVRHRDEMWEVPVDVDFVLHDAAEVRAAVGSAGLEAVEWYLRAPYEGAEVETERLYVLGRRPA